MLRSIYRVASSGASPSRDSFCTFFHRGVLQVVRCAASARLEFFEVERRESSIAVTSQVLQPDCGGGEEGAEFLCVHALTQR